MTIRLPDDIYTLIIEHAGTAPELKPHEIFQQSMSVSVPREEPEYALFREVIDALAFLSSAALVCKRWLVSATLFRLIVRF